MSTALISLTHWQGCPHWYATIWYENGDHERVSRALTAVEAGALTVVENAYEVGEISERFLTQESAIDAGIAQSCGNGVSMIYLGSPFMGKKQVLWNRRTT